jgi:hypothetical protein
MSADEFRALYRICRNRRPGGHSSEKTVAARERLERARDRGHRAKFVGARRRRPYSVHASAAQLGDLRNRIQPLCESRALERIEVIIREEPRRTAAVAPD